MSAPFLGEVRAWACNFAPYQWAFCQGQVLPIQQYSALFALLGTVYGGNGTSTFALPDLRGRVPMHYGQAPYGDVYTIGEISGSELVTLISTTMPMHTHTLFGTSASGTKLNPADNTVIGSDTSNQAFYATAVSLTNINQGTVSIYQGGNQPHENRQPYLAINWCIAMAGIFPTRN
jgi:microcystin-dependent protein